MKVPWKLCDQIFSMNSLTEKLGSEIKATKIKSRHVKVVQLLVTLKSFPYWDSMASHRWPSVVQGILTDGPSVDHRWPSMEMKISKTACALEDPIFLRLHNTWTIWSLKSIHYTCQQSKNYYFENHEINSDRSISITIKEIFSTFEEPKFPLGWTTQFSINLATW